MVKRWHGLDFHHEWLVQQNVWQGCSFLWIWQRLKRVVISPDCLPIYQYDHALWEELFPTVLTSFTSLLEQPQSPQAIPASSPGASSNTGPVNSSCTSLSSSPTTSPSNSSCSPSSSVTVDTKTAFVPQPSEPLFIHDLRICAANDCSRGQLATLNLPPSWIPDDDIELVVDPGCLNNPLQSPVRPSESAITKGYRLMHAATGEDSDDEDFDTAVKFGDLGVFDSRALDIVWKHQKLPPLSLESKKRKIGWKLQAPH